MFYPLAASSWADEEIAAIQRVIDGDMYTMGANVQAFEEEFAAYHGMNYGVMVNSGSSANLIAVAAQFFKKNNKLKRGDEVIVPAVSWATTYHPLQQYGLKMKIVDIDLDTLNMDVAQLEDALTPNTKMLVAVSILGNPCDLDVMRAFCDKHGLVFMEDNCESLDAELNGKKAGTFGDVNTFSFFFSHHIATMEGGMILTNDLETYHLMRALRAHGWTRDLPKDSPVFEGRSDDFFEAYRFILPGYNVRPTEMSGAIGREQLKKMPGFTAQRRKNLALLTELLGPDERFIIQRENGVHSSFCFPIILNPAMNIDRERVFRALEAADIGYRIITGGCILRHDVTEFYDYETVGEVANANIAHDNGFFCGNHPHDLTPQIRKLHEVLDEAAQPA
ncbi:DegT/DnrJ/EryC1/StrS family aminotransferase [Thalassospiraceae bacterium LMO-JJ14]|nr:DegT/DnrJ/EryC1/StrS family aminotransferase [Thalassospiraceae bacterium LMO-JJ14]